MAIVATYAGESEQNNTKGLLFNLGFSGNYGVNGVGDLINLNPNAVLDPKAKYNLILAQPPENPGVNAEFIGGYYVQLQPNVNPTLSNLGCRVYAPAGAELATNAAYPAAVIGGSVQIEVFLPLQ